MDQFSHFTDDVTTSLAFRLMIDRALVASRDGQCGVADVFARAAEGLLKAALPEHADAISTVGSRKGVGREIGLALAQRLSPTEAGGVVTTWLLRGARRPAADALSEAFRHDPEFDQTVRLLCRRVFEPTTVPIPCSPMIATPIEVASSHRR